MSFARGPSDVSPGRRPDGRPLVIAHRGASAHRPENTRSAFELAVEQGADMIETDLHATRDGRVVLAHDPALPGLGPIAEASLDQVRALDAGDGQTVPTLEETLDAFGARIAWNLEIKRPDGGWHEGIESAAVAAAAQRGILPRMLFSSFYDPVLERVRAADGAARTGLLVSRRYPHEAVRRAVDLGAAALHPEEVVTTPELVAAAHEAGLAVYVFTVDDAGAMERLLGWGVDGLFTNRPDRLCALLDGPSPAG